jgi:hypothetical protein
MDNIVDYLVVIFFVISFLSSIFKKKKKTEVKSVKKPQRVRAERREFERKERTENPLQDFFKTINNELVAAKNEARNEIVNISQNASHSEVDEYYEQALLNSESKAVVEDYTFQQTATVPLL